MVRIEVIRDITVLSSPRLESLQLALGLAHVAIEVIEVAKGTRLGPRISVGRIEAFVVFDEDEHAVFARFIEQLQMVREELGGWLRDQDVDLALDGIQGDREVGRVRGEDGDGRAGL